MKMLFFSFVALSLSCGSTECVKDTDCSRSSDVCKSGSCVALSPGGCSVDSDCRFGRRCVSGSCQAISSDGGIWGNAAGVIAGAQIGTVISANTVVTKQLQVTASGNASFQVVSASLSRSGPDSETGYLAVRVRNVGPTTQCYIKVEALSFSDANAAPVLDAGSTFVRGTVARTSSFTTSTCLEPGGEGFFVGIELDSRHSGGVPSFYSRTTSLGLAWGSTLAAITPLRARMIPRQYTASISPGYTYPDVVMTFVNEGPVTVTHSNPTVLMIPLDSTGRGLQWGFLSSTGMSGSSGSTAPGASYVVKTTHTFQGSATVVYSHFNDFEDCTTCLIAGPLDARPLDLDTPEGTERLLRAWTEREEAKRRAIEP